MRRFIVVLGLVALVAGLGTVGLAGDGETADDSLPRLIAVNFHSDSAKESKEIDSKFLAKVRSDMADKDILFVTADVTSRGSRHQAKMLLNSLGLQEIWKKYSATPGKVVVVDVDMEGSVLTFGAGDDYAKVKSSLERVSSKGDEGCGCDDGCSGCDDGCGCDDSCGCDDGCGCDE